MQVVCINFIDIKAILQSYNKKFSKGFGFLRHYINNNIIIVQTNSVRWIFTILLPLVCTEIVVMCNSSMITCTCWKLTMMHCCLILDLTLPVV